MGDNDLKEMRRGYMHPSGRDLTNTGRILGMAATALMAVPLLLLVFFLVVSIVASH